MDQATTHIKQMKERVEMLKQRKQQILEGHISNADKVVSTGGSGSIIRSSMITVSHLDSIMEVCLTCGLTDNFILICQVIHVLMEEAARVVSLNYSIMGNKIFYTIHAEVFIYVAMYDNWLLEILRKNARQRKVE